MTDPVLDFWFDFASTYSYLAAARIRPLAAAAECAGALPPVPARADLQGAGLGHVAVQSLRGEGPLHVARHGAAGRRPRAAVPPSRSVSAEQPAAGARGAGRAWREGWGEDFLRRRLPRAVRRGRPDRRAAHPRRNPVAHERRCAGRARSRAIGRHQASPAVTRSKRRRSSACSARRASPPRTASCSGATTGSEQALAWAKRGG